MSNLLDKASIILTPTAYNNGEALCIKPSDGSGDFQFSRNSAATRVNAQGLVENVQILSSNLVQNGDFSEEGSEEVSNGSFSQEGSELIVNGNFDTDTWWSVGQYWSIGNGLATRSVVGSELNFSLSRSSLLTIGKSYKVVISITSVESGNVKVVLGATDGTEYTSAGTYTYYGVCTSNTNFKISPSNDFNGSIDNVSVREVGQDWILGSGTTIGDGIANITQSGGVLSQSGGIMVSGKSFKITFTISNYVSGSIAVSNSTPTTYRSGNGTYTLYAVGAGGDFIFFSSSFVGSVTNISVKEVGQNWTLGTGWSIGDSVANAVDAAFNSQIIYSNNVVASTKYKVSFNVSNYVKGSVRVNIGNVGSDIVSSNGNFTFVLTSANAAALIIQTWAGGSGTSLSVTNISVIEITTDTNLPRINYEGFSYQDVLGSELVVNGDFATDSNWSKDANWSIANGVATSNGFGRMFQSIPFLETNVGTKVKVSFDITEKTNGGVVVNCYGGVSQLFTSVGTHTFVTTTINSTNLYFNNVGAGGGFIGSIDNVSVKEYLGQEVVPDSGCGSWLFEPQSTNLVLYSEDFSDAYWTKSRASVTDNSLISPDGTLNASKFTQTTSTAWGGVVLTIIPSGTSTLSIFAKKIDNDYIAIIGHNINDTKVYFNLDNGTLGTIGADVTSADIQDYGNGWFRCVLTASSINRFTVLHSTANNGNTANLNTETSLWGAMLEQNSFSTSYIPTEGSTVTRNQDLCNNGGSLASINSTEGVLYAEIAKRQDNNDSYILISLNNQASNSDNNSVTIGFSNSTGFFLRIRASGNSYLLFQGSSVLANKNQFYKVALKYKSGNSSVFIDGVNVLNSTDIFSFNQSLDNLSFDFNGNGGYPFYGKTKALAVWKEALSDQELAELTTI